MICCRCKADKPSTEFHKDSSRKYGHVYQCKSCVKNKMLKYYQENYEVLLLIDHIEYMSMDHAHRPAPEGRRQAMIEYAKTERGRKARLEASRRAYIKHRPKWDARHKLRYAVTKGEIIKPDICDNNGLDDLTCRGKIQAHHHLGYEGDHWKDVQWLCPVHHGKVHRKYDWETNELAKNKKGNNDNQS